MMMCAWGRHISSSLIWGHTYLYLLVQLVSYSALLLYNNIWLPTTRYVATYYIFDICIRPNVSTLQHRNQTPMTCKFDDGEDDFTADIPTCFRLTVVYKTGSDRHTISPNDIVVSQVQWNYECR